MSNAIQKFQLQLIKLTFLAVLIYLGRVTLRSAATELVPSSKIFKDECECHLFILSFFGEKNCRIISIVILYFYEHPR